MMSQVKLSVSKTYHFDSSRVPIYLTKTPFLQQPCNTLTLTISLGTWG